MKAKPEKEKIQELKVIHDGRHTDGFCVVLGEMIISRHNDQEAAQVVCNKLNNLMQRRR